MKQRREIAKNMSESSFPDLQFDEEALRYISWVDGNLRAIDMLIGGSMSVYLNASSTLIFRTHA